MRCLACLVASTLLAACTSGEVAERNSSRTDSAVATALASPIMVDARLRGESNRDALSPPVRPMQAIVPPGDLDASATGPVTTLVARAASLAAQGGGAFRSCDWSVRYSYGWAARLPSDLPLPDDARTQEAAGTDTERCRLRIIRFITGTAPDRTIAFYRNTAKLGSYAVREIADAKGVMAVRNRDGAAFVIAVGPASSGSTVDLLINRGS